MVLNLKTLKASFAINNQKACEKPSGNPLKALKIFFLTPNLVVLDCFETNNPLKAFSNKFSFFGCLK
ncbi:hypothetical protein OUQ_0080 [Helicobacter pylori R055a]|nr:hypothetical protein OUQ_0080 [Helicobacter pylori R055a]